MINGILTVLKVVVALLPFLIFVLLNGKTNLKRDVRCCQFLMPVISLVLCILVVALLNPIDDLLMKLINLIPNLLTQFASWVSGLFNGGLSGLGSGIESVAHWLDNLNWDFWIYVIVNTVFMLVYIVVKRILTAIFGKTFKNDGRFKNFCVKFFYEKDETEGWCVRPEFCQGRTLLKVFYIAVIVLAMLMTIVARIFFENGLLVHSFFPAFGICVIGELYFFLNGLSAEEKKSILAGESDQAYDVVNYSLLRKALRNLFPDKLEAEDTKTDLSGYSSSDNESILSKLELGDSRMEEAYSIYLRAEAKTGLDIDQGYMLSGLELLRGNSVLFNDPFYYDLIPYIFYPMNRTLLCGKKVLVLLGRNAVENDIKEWCQTGMSAVHHLECLWDADVLTQDGEETPDVGIITRADIQNIDLHEKNKNFFKNVGFVVIVEPSRLLPSAQIGLSSIVRRFSSESRDDIVYCSMDKNCDGLVDALSHLLMTNITEVSATQRAHGTSSYMCWLGDGDHMQHRLMLNIARYLGFGTEISFAALKNQVSRTVWYGGEAFPVRDMHWIAKQYYHDLLDYAGLPATQDSFDTHFVTSSNMWLARQEKYSFLTVEDEDCNMFESKRNFSTRALEQGFVNIISPEYLLKDYMASNSSIFDADPKAIPYVVADYARTPRNVSMRLILLLSASRVWESEIRQELMMVGVDGDDIRAALWEQICSCFSPLNQVETGKDGAPVLRRTIANREFVFDVSVLQVESTYRSDTGKFENLYHIQDDVFIREIISPLQSARYLAEDERADRQLLGQELRGHIFQKLLPGQFFVFDGKYYEMLSETAAGDVMVRRAADHIRGRISYRQVRTYTLLTEPQLADVMGAKRETAGFSVISQVADLQVDTTAYWELEQYNNFETGKKIDISGIPQRKYLNKNILCLHFPDSISRDVRYTLTLLINEVFRTLFAENSDFIIAATSGEDHPEQMTYSLQGGQENCIYIIEDSQMDIGLLVAAERNLGRIFRIICDYLEWHLEEVEKSKNPPPPPMPPEYPEIPERSEEPEKKPNIFRRIWNWIRKTLHIGGNDQPAEPEAAPGTAGSGEEIPSDGQIPDQPEEQTDAVTDETADPRDSSENEPAEETTDSPSEESGESQQMESRSMPFHGGSDFILRDQSAGPEEENTETTETDTDEASDGAGEDENEPDSDDMFDFEEPDFEDHEGVNERLPYHQRYYLLYGGTEVPEGIAIKDTIKLLRELGYGDSFLTQARKGVEEAKEIEEGFKPGQEGVHYCDFCGRELTGIEYEVLKDGRERCKTCGASAVKTEEEFKELFQEVQRNMNQFYGVRISAPITVRMVNAKKLHKELGQTFVPTGAADGRTLGVAIKNRKGEYSILLENGSPRINSIATMAHELTHIWQYLNWDDKKIIEVYGEAMRLEVYEGMAKWAEIQYLILLGEKNYAKREEIITENRDDEYGRGFIRYIYQYPLSYNQELGDTPFHEDLPLALPDTGNST